MTTTKQPGFAPAASPHAATAVHTPEEHIIAERDVDSLSG